MICRDWLTHWCHETHCMVPWSRLRWRQSRLSSLVWPINQLYWHMFSPDTISMNSIFTNVAENLNLLTTDHRDDTDQGEEEHWQWWCYHGDSSHITGSLTQVSTQQCFWKEEIYIELTWVTWVTGYSETQHVVHTMWFNKDEDTGGVVTCHWCLYSTNASTGQVGGADNIADQKMELLSQESMLLLSLTAVVVVGVMMLWAGLTKDWWRHCSWSGDDIS